MVETVRSSADGDGDDDAVVLDTVRKTYDRGGTVVALDDVSLTLPRGSYTAVMGPSGSGKSTLMNVIGCLDTPTTGSVRVDGRDVSALSEDARADVRGQHVGFVFQTFQLMPRLSARDNVALPLVFQGWRRGDRSDRAATLLDRVGLGDRLDHRPSELSGGQRQRVAIARALANEPAILLADEPTGNLDQTTGDHIMGVFEELHERGNTILVVTHERDIAEHAEHIVHLRDGVLERVEAVENRRVAVAPSTDSWGDTTPDHADAPDDSRTTADSDSATTHEDTTTTDSDSTTTHEDSTTHEDTTTADSDSTTTHEDSTTHEDTTTADGAPTADPETGGDVP